MSKTILPCRRFCCARKAKTRAGNTSVNNKSSVKTSPSNRILSALYSKKNAISRSNEQLHSSSGIVRNNETISATIHLNTVPNDVELDRLTKEYLETINEYRFHLGFSSLELSNELTNRALHRASELSRQNHVENTNRYDLIHDDEPIGETAMSCRAPITSGNDLAKTIHDQLIVDLENGQSTKKRYTPILNPDCQYLGFGLVRNEEKTKDFIVIYYYPVQKNQEPWQTDENSITQ